MEVTITALYPVSDLDFVFLTGVAICSGNVLCTTPKKKHKSMMNFLVQDLQVQ